MYILILQETESRETKKRK